ncbi:MAG: ATP-grasp domain-containing protein [Candidatus Saccharimonadales bacterium]
MSKVLIITIGVERADRSQTLKTFTEGLNAGGDVFGYAVIQDVLFQITDGVLSISLDGKELREVYDTIHLRNHDKYTDYANAIRVYCDARGMRLVNRADAVLPYFGKLSQGALLATNNLPTPNLLTMYGNAELLEQLIQANWSYPFVLKHNEGIRGVDNFLVKDQSQLETVLRAAKPGFIAQPFIKNTGELRVLTFGYDVPPLVFRKFAVEGEYLNNTSQGGSSEFIDAATVQPGMMQDALAATKLMGREIGGVDVLLAADGSHYILEVNSTPAIASGVYLPEKQDLYRTYFTDEQGAQ